MLRALRVLSVGGVAAVLAGCGGSSSSTTSSTPQPPSTIQTAPNTQALRTVRLTEKGLAEGGRFAEDIWIACLLNYYSQGIPLSQAKELCAAKLVEVGNQGFGIDVPGPRQPGDADLFDPAEITAACGSGDERVSAGKSGGTNSVEAVLRRASDIPGFEHTRLPGGSEGYGYYTYGGAGKNDPEDGKPYRGLTKEQAEEQKTEAIEEAENLKREVYDLEERVKNEQDPQKKAELQKELDAKKREWSAAHDKASDDPNKKEPGVSHTGGPDPSACDEALQTARETLYECDRSGWKSPGCQSLLAKMTRTCPEPDRIYVDPDAGYTCVPSVDPKGLQDAVVARCEELKRGVEGENPCLPPTLDPSGRFLTGKGTREDLCNDPAARFDPEQQTCVTPIEVPRTFGEPDLQKLVVFALNKFGGPVVVLPNKEPSPKPGPTPSPPPP